jgi:hypothetical protein
VSAAPWRVAAVALLLSACGDDGGALAPPAPPPQALCLDFSCGELTPLLEIPDAENLLFTDSGRLFVSGGENVYEIHRGEGGALQAEPLSATPCNFTGLAIRADTLYAGCFDGQLYAAPLSAVTTLAAITALGIAAPNGMAVGPDDALYIVNGPLATTALPDPRILRVAFAETDPLRISAIDTWLDQGLLTPNGLQAHDGAFYLTDNSLPEVAVVRRIPWTAEGPGTVTTVAQFLGVPDDLSLMPTDEGVFLLVPDFALGGLRLFAPDGTLLGALPPLSLRFPSQARRGQPPLFSSDDILITEKGVLGDTVSPIGNRLTVLRPRPAED